MLKRMFAPLLALIAVLGMSSPALAWGKIGHRVTGKIAEDYLTPKAKAEIAKIMPDETVAEVSNWPDFMRSNPSEFWQHTSPPWHYVTVPVGKTYAEVGAPQQGDAITALAHFTKVLKDPNASQGKKAVALKFVIHIIGDLQQPLHVGNGTDRGGNDFAVTWFGQPNNLHRVWDSTMIDDEKLSYTELSHWLELKITPEEVKEWSSSDPMVWLADSARLRDQIYPDSHELGYSYAYEHIGQVHEQLTKAGLRIAAYLNEVFQ